MNRALVSLLFLFCSFIEVQVKAAEEAVVIEIKKNVSLSKNDKVYRHFFINGGANLGLVKGAMVDVIRREAVHDPLKNAAIGDIHVKIAQLEIIYSEAKISVAKLVSIETPETRPVLEFDAVMIGDRLDLGSVKKAAVATTVDPNLVQKVALLESEGKAEETIKGARGPASLKKAKASKKSKRASVTK